MVYTVRKEWWRIKGWDIPRCLFYSGSFQKQKIGELIMYGPLFRRFETYSAASINMIRQSLHSETLAQSTNVPSYYSRYKFINNSKSLIIE